MTASTIGDAPIGHGCPRDCAVARLTQQNGAVPLKVKITLAVLLVVMGGLFAYVLSEAATGPDQTSFSKPDYVERLIPSSGSEALRQATVGVDLREGYDAYLVINGVTIQNSATTADDDGLRKAPSLGTVEYDPGPGRRITELNSPKQCVDAWVWKKLDGPTTAVQVNWCFEVT